VRMITGGELLFAASSVITAAVLIGLTLYLM
jgi:hypothetical protein